MDWARRIQAPKYRHQAFLYRNRSPRRPAGQKTIHKTRSGTVYADSSVKSSLACIRPTSFPVVPRERERGGGQRRGASRRRLRPLSFLLVRLIALYDQDYGRCLLNRLFCRWHHATTWLREPAPSLLSARALRSNGDRRCGDAGAERSQAVGASAGRKAPSRSRRGPASGNLPRSRPRRAAPRPAGATPARAPGPSPGTPRTQSPAAAARA